MRATTRRLMRVARAAPVTIRLSPPPRALMRSTDRARPRRTILGHDRRSRCRAQAGVPISADETSAWDGERASRVARWALLHSHEAVAESRRPLGHGLSDRPL